MTISTALSGQITVFLRERGRPGRRPTPSGRWSSRPRLEVLEDQTLLNTDIVTNTNDHGPGSLRATISSASPGDTIAFASGVTGTITLTNEETARMNRNRVVIHVRQETRRARSLLDPVPGHFLRPSDNAAPRFAETFGKLG